MNGQARSSLLCSVNNELAPHSRDKLADSRITPLVDPEEMPQADAGSVNNIGER